MSNKDHEKEISRHNLGTLCFLGGLGLIILVCFAMHGGTASAVLGMVGVGGNLPDCFCGPTTAVPRRSGNSRCSRRHK